MGTWRLVLTLGLAATFGWSGLVKLARPERWTSDLRRYRLPRPLKALALVVVPWTEVGIAGLMVVGKHRTAALLVIGMLAPLSAAIVRLQRILRSNEVPCGCLGTRTARDYRLLLARNGALALAAAALFASPAPSQRDDWFPPFSDTATTVVVVAWMCLVVAWTVSYLRFVYDPNETEPTPLETSADRR